MGSVKPCTATDETWKLNQCGANVIWWGQCRTEAEKSAGMAIYLAGLKAKASLGELWGQWGHCPMQDVTSC